MELHQQWPAIRTDRAVVVAISNEDRQRGAKMKTELALPFLILSDPERRAIVDYGVFHEQEPKGRPIARPAAFVLDTAGIIRFRYVGESQTDRPDAKTLLSALANVHEPASR